MLAVRRARPDDDAGIVAAHAAAIRARCRGRYAAADVEAWVERGLARDAIRDEPGRRDVLVAADAERIAGFAILDVPRAEVHALYVRPDAGEAGVGRRLLADLEAVARLRGLAALRLDATLNAVAFYAAAGWRRTGDALRRFPGGRDIACVAMAKRVPAARPVVRDEAPGDRDAIRAVEAAAFARDAEADLVDGLRDAGALVLSLVATLDHDVVGHVAFSPVAVPGVGLPVLGLAPVAVRPALQRCALGARLIEEGLARGRERGAGAVFVLGDPAYYRRFGFVPSDRLGVVHPDAAVPAEAFMAAELVSGALAAARGAARHHPAFATVA